MSIILCALTCTDERKNMVRVDLFYIPSDMNLLHMNTKTLLEALNFILFF